MLGKVTHPWSATCFSCFSAELKKEEAPEVIQITQTEPSLAQSTLPPEGRIEYIPIQWHAALHTDTLGIDR